MKDGAALVRRHLEGIAWADPPDPWIPGSHQRPVPGCQAPRSRRHTSVHHQDSHLYDRRKTHQRVARGGIGILIPSPAPMLGPEALNRLPPAAEAVPAPRPEVNSANALSSINWRHPGRFPMGIEFMVVF